MWKITHALFFYHFVHMFHLCMDKLFHIFELLTRIHVKGGGEIHFLKHFIQVNKTLKIFIL